MAGERISQLPIQATVGLTQDYLLISKYLGGTLYQSQKIAPDAILYDSGEKQINIFNGSFGMANIGPAYRPYIRVINRTVHLIGTYIIPMDNGAGGLDPVGIQYPDKYRQLVHNNGADSFLLGSKGDIISRSPVIPSALYPKRTALQDRDIWTGRTIEPSVGDRIRLSSLISGLYIRTDGKLVIESIETQERDGLTGTGYQKTYLGREICSRFDVGDDIMDYTAWRNSFSGGGTIDNRIYTDGGSNYDFTHDASTAHNLGGYVFYFNLIWEVDETTTIDQIKAAFDSI
jgi:hypothetical protein